MTSFVRDGFGCNPLRLAPRMPRNSLSCSDPDPPTLAFGFPCLGGRFGYFLFFLLGGAEKGSPRRREGGVRFYIKSPRRGGLPGGWGRGGEGLGGCLRGIWEGGGGGAKFFFFGAEIPAKLFCFLAHQNRTIAIASAFRVDGAKSPEIPQNEGVQGSEIAARKRRSLATFHRTLKSQCSIALSCLGNRCDFWGLRWAARSQIAEIAAISVR